MGLWVKRCGAGHLSLWTRTLRAPSPSGVGRKAGPVWAGLRFSNVGIRAELLVLHRESLVIYHYLGVEGGVCWDIPVGQESVAMAGTTTIVPAGVCPGVRMRPS